MAPEIAKGALVSRLQMAKLLGVARTTLDDWVGKGLLVHQPSSKRGSPAKFDTAKVIDWVIAYRVSQALASRGGEGLDLNAERARLAREQADGQAMKNKAARGELLPAEDVVSGWQAAVGRSRALMLGMPIAVAPQLVMLARQHEGDAAGLERAAREAMTRSLDAALAELSNTTVDEDDDEEEPLPSAPIVEAEGAGAEA